MKKNICVKILLLGISLLFVKTSYGIEGVSERKIIKIGIIPVVNKPMNLREYKQCFVKWKYKKHNNTGLPKITDGYEASVVIRKDASCAPNLKPGNLVEVLDTKEVSLSSIIYGQNPVNLTNVHIFKTESDKYGDITLYPLSMIGDYWNKQIQNNGIIKTDIGDNLNFVTTVEEPVVRMAKFQSEDEFRKHLDAAFDSSGISRSKYNYTVMVYFDYPCSYMYPETDQPGCYMTKVKGRRGSAYIGNKKAYAEFSLSTASLNSLFKVIIHELGHAMFGLKDTYEMSKLRGVMYPEGVVSTVKSELLAPKTRCLMSGKVPNPQLEPVKDTSTGGYWIDTIDEMLTKYGISPTFVDNPYINILCPYDLAIIKKSFFNTNSTYSTLAMNKNSEEKPSCDRQDVREDAGEIDLGIRFVKQNIFPIASETTGKIEYAISATSINATEGVDYNFGYTSSNPLKIVLDRNTTYDVPLTNKLKIIDRPGKQYQTRTIKIEYVKPAIGKYEIKDKGCKHFKIIDND